MKRTKATLPAALLLAAACAYVPPPVPVAGPDAATLVGEWTGEYQADEPGGRSGTIALRLSAQSDTAYGEVMMVVAGPELSTPLPRSVHLRPGVPEMRPLTIRLVRAEAGTVSGTLDTYVDPDCGSPVRTTFAGRLAGGVIEGTYSSLHVDHGYVATGRWSVRRTAG